MEIAPEHGLGMVLDEPSLAALYHEDAVNHQVALEPVREPPRHLDHLGYRQPVQRLRLR